MIRGGPDKYGRRESDFVDRREVGNIELDLPSRRTTEKDVTHVKETLKEREQIF